jgi:hypothetical protein
MSGCAAMDVTATASREKGFDQSNSSSVSTITTSWGEVSVIRKP